MKTAVIYLSKYGATETYAKWLAEELGAGLLQAGRAKPADLERYQTIIYGGGIYAGGVSGISLLIKNFDRIKDKRLYLFTVGVSDVTDPETPMAIRKALEQKLPPAMWEKIHLYHLQGGIQYSKLNFIHRTIMSMLVKEWRSKPESELLANEKRIINTYGQDFAVADRSSIAPLVADIKAGK